MGSSDLDKLSRDLRKHADKVGRETPRAVKRGGVQIKREWSLALKARSLVHARALPSAVNFDEVSGDGYGSVEVGPDKTRNQGPLGNLLEFGSKEHGTEAGLEGEKALHREAPKLAKVLEDMADYGI